MDKIFAPFLPPWAETGLQPAFYDVESGTVLQQTARMYDKVNQLTRLFNELSEETQETVNDYIERFTELYNYVHDYFDNLDVQDEVDHKLDEMVIDGTMQELVNNLLQPNVTWTFDTVADMQAFDNFENGCFAQTLGYYAKDDGGAGLYKIRTITGGDVVDEGSIIEIGDGSSELIAELITNEANFAQFGAKGDGVTDDTTATQNALTFAKANHLPLTAPEKKVYLVRQHLQVDNLNVDLNYSTLKTDTAMNEMLYINIQDNTNYSDWYGEIQRINIDCTNLQEGINITMGRKKSIHHINLFNVSYYGIYYHTGYEVTIKDCNITAVGDSNTGASADSVGLRCDGGDSYFMDMTIINCANAIYNRGLNFYRGIHAWIRTHSLAPSAIMFRVGGNVPAFISQCYSDTYGITFSMRDAWLIADQVYIYFNSSIYEDTYSAPILFNNEDSLFNGFYQRKTTFTNSDIRGVSNRDSQKLQYKSWNTDCSIKSFNNNLTRVQGYNSPLMTSSLTAGTAVTQIVQQRITDKGDLINLNLVIKVDTSVNRAFTVTGLPTQMQPSGEINTGCFWGNNDVYAVDGVGYLKITGGTISGKVVGGTDGMQAYVKINVTYPVNSYSIEY